MSWISGLVAILLSFFTTALFGIVIIPILKRFKCGQSIKKIGPTWHEYKSGTPTMGGILFIIGIVFSVFVGYFIIQSSKDSALISDQSSIRLWGGVLCALGFGLIGLIDDYIKVIRKRNQGLSALQKTGLQFIIAITYFLTMMMSGCITTIVDIPFAGQIDIGWFYYVIAILGIYGVVNAVNLTDGIDGLAGSVTTVYAIIFMIMSSFLHMYTMHLLAAALSGGCLGFLVWNFYPAKVFMGDTGSMFLGGLVVALGFGINQPLFILIVGIVYIIEALSVVIQVISFKLTGKRVFKMSPIHHHFEMCGWSEVKIVAVFSLFTAAFGIIGILCLLFGIL